MTRKKIRYRRFLRSLGRNKNVAYLVLIRKIKKEILLPITCYSWFTRFFSLFKKQNKDFYVSDPDGAEITTKS